MPPYHDLFFNYCCFNQLRVHWICRFFGRIGIFTILFLLIYEHGRSFYLLESSVFLQCFKVFTTEVFYSLGKADAGYFWGHREWDCVSEFFLSVSVFGILRLPIFMLICYAATLLEEPSSANGLLRGVLGFLMYRIISYANKDELTSSFHICALVTGSYCFIFLVNGIYFSRQLTQSRIRRDS